MIQLCTLFYIFIIYSFHYIDCVNVCCKYLILIVSTISFQRKSWNYQDTEKVFSFHMIRENHSPKIQTRWLWNRYFRNKRLYEVLWRCAIRLHQLKWGTFFFIWMKCYQKQSTVIYQDINFLRSILLAF